MAWTTPGTAVAGDVLTAAFWNEQVRDNLDSVLSFGKVALFRDEKSSGTNGGDFASGDWRTRVLNTTAVNTITGCSLASNQITLPAGSYFIIGRAPAYQVDIHKVRLRNTTDSTNAIEGSTQVAGASDNISNEGWVMGFVTIAASKVFEFQHRCGLTKNGTGFGVSTTQGTEVYAEILIWKVS